MKDAPPGWRRRGGVESEECSGSAAAQEGRYLRQLCIVVVAVAALRGQDLFPLGGYVASTACDGDAHRVMIGLAGVFGGGRIDNFRRGGPGLAVWLRRSRSRRAPRRQMDCSLPSASSPLSSGVSPGGVFAAGLRCGSGAVASLRHPPRCCHRRRPVSKARKPGGVQAIAAARPSAVTPAGTPSPWAKASCIAAARSAFLSLPCACAQASPSVSAGDGEDAVLAQTRPQQIGCPDLIAVAADCSGKVDVEPGHGRFDLRPGFGFERQLALQRARDAGCEQGPLVMFGKRAQLGRRPRRQDRQVQSSFCPARSILRCFSPTLMVPKASSLTRMAGRSGVSAALMSSASS